MKNYPEGYNGPKTGEATQEEWLKVRDYDAFCYVKDGTWTYSDFDCYLYAMCEEYFKKGEKRTLDALTEMQKNMGIR